MFELILACALKKVIMGKKVHNLYLRSKGQGEEHVSSSCLRSLVVRALER